MKVTVYSHALIQDAHRARWRRFAELPGNAVTVVVPAAWSTHWFGSPSVTRPAAVSEGDFRVLPLPVIGHSHWGRYVFRSSDAGLRSLRPDVIMAYGEEFSLLLQQLILYRRWWCPRARLAFFSWNNLGVLTGRRRALKRLLWRRVCRRTDMAITGNGEGGRLFREAGYPKPLVVQTELGVDETELRPDPEARQRLRADLQLAPETFVVGFVGRLTEEKGLADLVTAGAGLGDAAAFLLVGDGGLRGELQARTRNEGLRAHFAGEVAPAAVASFLQAMDCLVLPSRTTTTWKEQFGLVLAQAMACGVPVIGSDSGAIPEVIGDAGLVFHEGSTGELRDCLERLLRSADERKRCSRAGRKRVADHYSATALACETDELFRKLTAGASVQ